MGRKTITSQEFYCATEKTQPSKEVYFKDQYQMGKKKKKTFCNLYVVMQLLLQSTKNQKE